MHTTTLTLKTGLAKKTRPSLDALRSKLGGAYRDWLRTRQARATARAMDVLDDRMLLDIGLDRSELLSAATELHGHGERQRRRDVLGTLQPR